MRVIQDVAPSGEAATDYDRCHLSLYAALLDAADAAVPWRDAASAIMGVDPDEDGAEVCWQSHLDRARWVVGDGLAQAIEAFGQADV